MKIKYQELLELGCRCCEISELLAKLQLEEQNNYLDFFYISLQKMLTKIYESFYKIITCDFFLVRKEPINTGEYHRVSIYRVNELKLFQKDIRSYQRVSTVLENLCGFCAVKNFY